jgi:hypothetical protein
MRRDAAGSFLGSTMADDTKITVTKLDAAKRQLQTAIRLWFEDDDPVSIHTLAFAAYEIAHVVSKKRNRARRDLIFDSLKIKEEHRAEWNKSIKRHASFFKHAKTDWDASIEFAPITSVLFMMGAGAGLRIAGEPESAEELALGFWLFVHRPQWVTATARKLVEEKVPIEDIAKMKTVPKSQFLKAVKMGPN